MTDTRGRPHATPAERWQRIQEVLAAAIESDAAGRRQLVSDRCGHDRELANEVESLLAAHESAGLIDRLSDAMAPATAWARAQAGGWEGRRVGHYVVRDLLGAGGMGLVYKARDERLGRYVALKFLSPHLGDDAAARQRFLVEARAAAALDHPNVCTILEIGEVDDGQLFMAMPLYEGETLRARLKRGPLSFAEAVPLTLQVASALGCAHQRGIVHCDVKPSNVMVLAGGTAKVLDFGVAMMDNIALAGHGTALGTLAYMSPEQLRGGAVDQRSDIWSLGILLHEMLTGTRPFGGDDRQAVSDAILTGSPTLVATSHPDVPAGVDDVLRRAIARRPEDRYPSMGVLATELAALRSADRRGFGDTSGDEPLRVGERRRAVVMVNVVSEYGALVEHMPPAVAHRVVVQIRNMAVDVVRRHGGLVNQAIGEEIVSLFGVPVAHEDDELRSVRAAIELHARVAELREREGGHAPAPVRVQSGLHVGPVVAQRLTDGPRRYAIVGAPAQVASGLAASAQPGDILLSSDCQRLVAPFLRADPCAGVMLTSEGKPLTAFRVTGETGLETRLEASERSGLTPYVGRESELALLTAHVDRARRGEGSAVLVVGEAGAGKSRLLHELRARAIDADGVRLLTGRCRGYEVAPYCPFIDILRDALDLRTLATGQSDDVVERIRAIAPSLDQYVPLYLHLLLVPSDRHPLPRHLQGEHLQAALLDALAAMIAALATRSTVVVLLEDWHWADAASRTTLDRMAESVIGQRVLFVVTSRPERAVLNRWPGARIPLEPLDFAASTSIVRAVLCVEQVSDALARQVFERSGGNPLFLEQICCALVERGAVDDRDGEAVVHGDATSLALPETIQAVIGTRLDTLAPNAREVLRAAAVIGREFQHALLAEVLDPEIDLTAALMRLKATGLIQLTAARPDVTYVFRHVLTHEVSYESLLGYQRKSLHERVGRAIERRQTDHTDDAAILAHHFEAAGLWPEAVRYGRCAAERASALSQFADALAMLDRVRTWLERLPDDEARRDLTADLLLQYERECETLGLRGRQREIIEELVGHLAPHGQSGRLAEAYLRQGDLFTLLKRFDAADRALTTGLRISRERGDAVLERNTLRSIGLLRWHEGRFEEALALAESALTIDRERGDESAVAGDLANLGSILKCMGHYAAARQQLEAALAMPALARDPKKSTYALHKLANVHRAMGDVDAALGCLRHADEICRAELLPIQRSFHLTSIAHMQLQQGHIESSIRTYEKAVSLSRRARHAEGLANSLRPLGEVLFGLGRDEEALAPLQEAARLFEQLEDPASEAEVRTHAATILERTDRHEESIDAWKRVQSLCEQLGNQRGLLDALEGTARAIRRRDRSSDAVLPMLGSAIDLASQLGDGHRLLALHNETGILEWARGNYTQALTHYEAALRLVREHGTRVQEALILNSLGVTLTKLNRPTEARQALEEGLARSRATGERLLEAQAVGALGQLSRTVGDLGRALECFEQSLTLRRALNDRFGEAWMLRRIAETLAAVGDAEAARCAAAAGARIANEMGDVELAAACEQAPVAP